MGTPFASDTKPIQDQRLVSSASIATYLAIKSTTQPGHKFIQLFPALDVYGDPESYRTKELPENLREPINIDIDLESGKPRLRLDTIRSTLARDDVDSLFLMHPNNPYGEFFEKEELYALLTIIAETGKTLIVDEILGVHNYPENIQSSVLKIIKDMGNKALNTLFLKETGKLLPKNHYGGKVAGLYSIGSVGIESLDFDDKLPDKEILMRLVKTLQHPEFDSMISKINEYVEENKRILRSAFKGWEVIGSTYGPFLLLLSPYDIDEDAKEYLINTLELTTKSFKGFFPNERVYGVAPEMVRIAANRDRSIINELAKRVTNLTNTAQMNP